MRDAFLERRRAAAAAAWNLAGGVVLVAAGDEIPVPGLVDAGAGHRGYASAATASTGIASTTCRVLAACAPSKTC
jgi:hypothetical protein